MSFGQFSTVLLHSLAMAFRVSFMGLGGYIMTKSNIIKTEFIHQLGKVIANFLMPCLIFGQLISTFSISYWQTWLPILLSTYFVVGFCDCGSINITLVIALADELNDIGMRTGTYRIFGQDQQPAERALGYVILAWVLAVALRWSLGYSMLAPSEYEIIEKRHEIMKRNSDHQYQSLINGNKEQLTEPTSLRESATLKYFKQDMFEMDAPKINCKERCKRTLNIPMIVSIIAIVFASIPPIRGLFVPKGAIFFSTITSTANFIGSANYIMMIIVLGANLALYKGDQNQIPTKVHLMAGGFRMVIFPLFGLGIIYGFLQAGAITDPILAFTMMLIYATPPSNNLMVMANLHNNLESDLARSLLITYVTSIFTMTLYTALFLFMIEN